MQSFFFLHCIHIKSSMLLLASINCLCLAWIWKLYTLLSISQLSCCHVLIDHHVTMQHFVFPLLSGLRIVQLFNVWWETQNVNMWRKIKTVFLCHTRSTIIIPTNCCEKEYKTHILVEIFGDFNDMSILIKLELD